MTTYEITTYLEGGWWVVDLPDVDAPIRAATLVAVEPAVRAAIARRLNHPPESFGIDIHAQRFVGGILRRTPWRRDHDGPVRMTEEGRRRVFSRGA